MTRRKKPTPSFRNAQIHGYTNTLAGSYNAKTRVSSFTTQGGLKILGFRVACDV